MIRDNLMHHEPVDGFRWRSHEISRVEGFSDAVFGFAVTLLIVSLEVPHTSTELLQTMRGFGAFLVTFFILAALWYSQFTFHRRYALEDRTTVILNLALLFVILFFVYPLKFLFTILFGDPRMHQNVMTAHGLVPAVLPEHKPIIFAIFGAGYVGVMLIFSLMYQHAYRQRHELALNEFEVFETRHTIRRLRLAVALGAMYFVIAFVEALPTRTAGEKRIATIGSFAVVAVVAFLFVLMLRSVRERRRVAREWKERQTPPQHPSE